MYTKLNLTPTYLKLIRGLCKEGYLEYAEELLKKLLAMGLVQNINIPKAISSLGKVGGFCQMVLCLS